ALLLCSYAGVLMAGVKWIGGLYVVQLLAKEEAKEQSSLVGMLLHDFQSGAADWLWRTDADHVIVDPSDRFAAALERTPAELVGANLFDLV
ncbi:hypothetical protein ABTN36_18330, partial [Acinetobacter baumannii]